MGRLTIVICVIFLAAIVQYSPETEAQMAGFMNEEKATEKYGSFIGSVKSRVSSRGLEVDKYDLLVGEDGEQVLFSFVYKDKPKGFRGSVPEYPDTNFVVDRKSEEIVKEYFSR